LYKYVLIVQLFLILNGVDVKMSYVLHKL